MMLASLINILFPDLRFKERPSHINWFQFRIIDFVFIVVVPIDANAMPIPML